MVYGRQGSTTRLRLVIRAPVHDPKSPILATEEICLTSDITQVPAVVKIAGFQKENVSIVVHRVRSVGCAKSASACVECPRKFGYTFAWVSRNLMHNGHFWHQEEYNKTQKRPRRKYSLFAKLGNHWKRVSPIICRNKRESELFFYKSLARATALGIRIEVGPI